MPPIRGFDPYNPVIVGVPDVIQNREFLRTQLLIVPEFEFAWHNPHLHLGHENTSRRCIGSRASGPAHQSTSPASHPQQIAAHPRWAPSGLVQVPWKR